VQIRNLIDYCTHCQLKVVAKSGSKLKRGARGRHLVPKSRLSAITAVNGGRKPPFCTHPLPINRSTPFHRGCKCRSLWVALAATGMHRPVAKIGSLPRQTGCGRGLFAGLGRRRAHRGPRSNSLEAARTQKCAKWPKTMRDPPLSSRWRQQRFCSVPRRRR